MEHPASVVGWKRTLWGGVTLALLLLPYPPAAASGEPALPERVYRDVDGEPLPFQSYPEAETFLRTATVVSQREIGVGVTRPKKLVLEKAGLRVHAAFNYVDVQEQGKRLTDGTVEMYFLDSYRADIGAYELSRLLGLEMVPPSVERQIDGQRGVVRLWIENLESYRGWLDAGHPGFPKSGQLSRQLQDQNTFDLLIRNADRNQTNIHWDPDGNLWLIDQTRTLAREASLIEKERKRFTGCSRELYEAMKSLDPKVVKRELKPYVGSFEIKALMKRRDTLLELIEARIERRGRDEVLFGYDDPPRDIVMEYEEGG